MADTLPKELLAALFVYDPDSGLFTYSSPLPVSHAAPPVFTPSSAWVRKHAGQPVPAHAHIPGYGDFARPRLIWAYQTNQWPSRVRLLDGNPDNLRFDNLEALNFDTPPTPPDMELTPSLLSRMFTYDATAGTIREKYHPLNPFHGRKLRYRFTDPKRREEILGRRLSGGEVIFTLTHNRFPALYEKIAPDGTASLKGIYFRNNRWITQYRGRYVGCFETLEEAKAKIESFGN